MTISSARLQDWLGIFLPVDGFVAQIVKIIEVISLIFSIKLLMFLDEDQKTEDSKTEDQKTVVSSS